MGNIAVALPVAPTLQPSSRPTSEASSPNAVFPDKKKRKRKRGVITFPSTCCYRALQRTLDPCSARFLRPRCPPRALDSVLRAYQLARPHSSLSSSLSDIKSTPAYFLTRDSSPLDPKHPQRLNLRFLDFCLCSERPISPPCLCRLIYNHGPPAHRFTTRALLLHPSAFALCLVSFPHPCSTSSRTIPASTLPPL